MGRSIEQENSFLQVLLKLIPSEVIAVFIFIQGVMPRLLLPSLIVTLLLVAITPLYLARCRGHLACPAGGVNAVAGGLDLCHGSRSASVSPRALVRALARRGSPCRLDPRAADVPRPAF
jgi:hypothetical protein